MRPTHSSIIAAAFLVSLSVGNAHSSTKWSKMARAKSSLVHTWEASNSFHGPRGERISLSIDKN